MDSSSSGSRKPKLKVEDDPPLPSQWSSPKIIASILILALGYAYETYHSVNQSTELTSGSLYVPRITQGWFLGRKQDLSDTQWRIWRENFFTVLISLIAFVIVSSVVKNTFQNRNSIRPILIFYNIVSFFAIFYIHGFDIIWLYLGSLVNYAIAKQFKDSKWNIALCWIFNVFYLFMGDYTRGFRGTFMSLGLSFLDSYHGVMNWSTYFKLTLLRHISFNTDYYWKIKNRPVPDLKNRSAYTIAQESHLPLSNYGLLEYYAYLYYIPLFIAGPVATFNAFVAQVQQPQETVPLRKALRMLATCLLEMLGIEIFLHFFYQYAFNQHNIWKTKNFTPFEVCMAGYWTLNFMYFKFLTIWKFFRTFALLDGIDSPENMNRCVNNNFSFTGFWRSWHGSLNKWIVRYLYVPLGGSATQAYSIWLIFTFIGLWHDLQLRWLAWAWCNCIFFSIEIMIIKLFSSHKLAWLRRKPYYRDLVAAGGTFNIFLLMVANLAILHGFDNTPVFIERAFFVEGGFTVFVLAFIWLGAGVQVMLEIREQEKRNDKPQKF